MSFLKLHLFSLRTSLSPAYEIKLHASVYSHVNRKRACHDELLFQEKSRRNEKLTGLKFLVGSNAFLVSASVVDLPDTFKGGKKNLLMKMR